MVRRQPFVNQSYKKFYQSTHASDLLWLTFASNLTFNVFITLINPIAKIDCNLKYKCWIQQRSYVEINQSV